MPAMRTGRGEKAPSAFTAAAIGMFSGLASAGVAFLEGLDLDVLIYLPGAAFGIVFAAYLLALGAISAPGAAAVMAANAIGNIAAMHTAIAIADGFEQNVSLAAGSIMSGLPAGFLGAGLAAGVFAVATGVRRPWQPILAGAVLGPLGPLATALSAYAVVPFFGLWQAVFAAAMIRSWQAARKGLPNQ